SMATIIDLTTAGTTAVGGAIFSTDVQTIGAGTGLIDPFSQIQAQGNNTTEQGYNTDSNTDILDNDGKGGTNFIHSHPTTSSPLQIINGTAYYRFELDINQKNSAGEHLLSLDAVQIWQAGDPALNNYAPGANPDQGTGAFPAGDSASLIYN